MAQTYWTVCGDCLTRVNDDPKLEGGDFQTAFWCPECLSGYPLCILCLEEHGIYHTAEKAAR